MRFGACLLAGLMLAVSAAVQAQATGTTPRIGILTGTGPELPAYWNPFIEGLRALGYVEGRNLTIEWRATQGKTELLPAFAADLVRVGVNVIVATDNPAIAAARDASKTIPIVMVLSTDPVGTGFIGSLARPGGNITGLSFQATDLQGKMLQLLKEAVPGATRVAVLWDPTEPGRRAVAREAEVAAGALGLQVQLVGVKSAAELDAVFAAMAKDRPHALLVQASSMIFAQRARIAALAAKNRLPVIGWRREIIEAGGLMSYGAAYSPQFRRAAQFVDRILKGAKPMDLPVEQPTTFDFFINLKTAKTLGLTIPQSMLMRADEVIQ
jgi:putative ABC transport system substrate-binding protein